MKPVAVLIVQPALPEYRIKLFNPLQAQLPEMAVRVLAANLDHNGVSSVHPTNSLFGYTITSDSKILFGICWQPKAVTQILRLKKSDTLVVAGNPRYLFNMIAACIAKLRGVKVIWWGQLWSLSTTKRSLRAKICLMQMVSTKLLLYTKREATLLSRLLAEKSVFFLNNGIDNTQICSLRKPYVAANRTQRILFLGRLTPKADVELLLKALAQVNHLVLDIVGGRASQELRQLITLLKLEARVTFHGEINDERQIAAIANECLFFVYPGAVGLSLIHAFNYGLPALLHDQRRKHMPEIAAFRTGVHGETFKRQDYNSLARAVTRMAENHAQLDRYSRNALQVSAEDYNTKAMVTRFAAAIRAE